VIAGSFSREEFDDADNYILDDRGTLASLSDSSQGKDPTQVKESVIRKVNELMLTPKNVVFTTNDSNASREDFIGKLLRRGLNVCNPEDAVTFLEREIGHIERNIARAVGTPSIQHFQQHKVEAEARLEHFKAKIEEAALNPQELSRSMSIRPKDVALRNTITTAYTCAWYLKQTTVQRPFVVCSESGILHELREIGITDYVSTLNEETGEVKEAYNKDVNIQTVSELLAEIGNVDAIVIGWDLKITAIKVIVAASLLQLSKASGKDIRLITCSSDKAGVLGVTSRDSGLDASWENMKLRHLGNGTMTSAVCACAGVDEGTAIDVGRPSNVFVQLLRGTEDNGLGLDFSRSIVIGDTLSTDIEMARRFGMRSLLVLSGVSTNEDVQKEQDPFHFPTWILESLAHI
jgi:ribonucleotide monophosphatase NagD (HAD superfamily)